MSRPTPRAVLAAADQPALLVSDLVNIRYLTGMPVTAGLVLVLPRRHVLLVDARYREMAERRVEGMVIRDIQTLPELLKDVTRCGFEANDVSVARFVQWKRTFPGTKLVRTTGVVGEFRRHKTDEERRLLRRAHKMTKELLRRVPSALRSQTSEERLGRQLLQWALELGADGLSFEPIVAFGTHTSSPHHRPTGRMLQKGHIVQIDVGVQYRGYCADMSEVFFTVDPTPAQRAVYDVLRKAKDKAMAAVALGVTNRALDCLAREVLRKHGIEQAFTHALGHGVGLEVHEGITLSSKAPETALVSGEVVAIEPGAYFPGKFGMRLEDMAYVA